MNYLLRHGADPNACNQWGLSPSFFATHLGVLEILERLIDCGASLSQLGPAGESLLHAAASGDPQIFSYLFHKGVNPYRKDYRGVTAVDMALRNGDERVIAPLLFNLGLDFTNLPGLLSARNFTVPLTSMLKLLFRRLPHAVVAKEVNQSNQNMRPGSADTPLCQAAKAGRVDTMALLIKHGADIELSNDMSCTPLLAACSKNQYESVRYLVRAGAKLFARKPTPPYSAVEAARPYGGILRWLLVERFTEQASIAHVYEQGSQAEYKLWAGIKSAEVLISGIYAPIHRPSFIERATELHKLRRRLRGKVVHTLGFAKDNSIAI